MSFYECDKCKRTWQHPIQICPYCLSSLNKVKSNKAKVFAVSKINIPTLKHPNVPYYALILEDENGHKWAQKSFKEYNVNDEIEFEKDENTVAIVKTKYDLLDATSTVIEHLGGLKASNVLIIPDLSSPDHAYLKENTSSQFLGAIIDYLLKNNIKDIKVACQSFNEIPVEFSAQKSGLLDVCTKRGIIPFDLAKTNFVQKGNLEISEEVLNADLVLNLAMCKIGKAEASLNLFKTLKKENYSSLKYLSSEKEIISELVTALPNIISIGEAETVQRSDRVSTYLGIILASKNAQKIDRVFNEIVEASKLPELTEDVDLNDIKTIGRDIKEVKYKAELY